MGVCPNCGSWVDEGDVCGCCGGSGSYESDETQNVNDMNFRRDECARKAWDFYNDFRDEDALDYIERALDIDGEDSENWNKKAIILEAMKRYEESERCYSTSLDLCWSDVVSDNMAKMLYYWALQLFEDSKKQDYGLDMLDGAKRIAKRAMAARPGGRSSQNIDMYLSLWDRINYSIGHERKYQTDLDELRGYYKSKLFTITGIRFNYNGPLYRNMPLELRREPDNAYDPDAIAVYSNGGRIGYVANSKRTTHELTLSASELQSELKDGDKVEYVLHLERYADVQFHIGRIVR